MKNKIAVVTSTYPNFGPEEALAGISAAGFKYVDMATCPGYFEHILPKPEDMAPGDYQQVVDKVASYNLKMISVSGHTRLGTDDGVERLKKVIDFASQAGVSYLVTDAGEDEDKFYTQISPLADYAQDKDITICLEMHGPWLNNGTKGAETVKKVDRSQRKAKL
ncbi:MAG: TIM barrel protein [Actinomycetota bacterium]|nr:TIM barrel protein [Actinomycetota bacterium]